MAMRTVSAGTCDLSAGRQQRHEEGRGRNAGRLTVASIAPPAPGTRKSNSNIPHRLRRDGNEHLAR